MLQAPLEAFLLVRREVGLQHAKVLFLLADVRLDEGITRQDRAPQRQRVSGIERACRHALTVASDGLDELSQLLLRQVENWDPLVLVGEDVQRSGVEPKEIENLDAIIERLKAIGYL